MGNSFHRAMLIAALAAAPGMMAQEHRLDANSIQFDLHSDAPIRLESVDSSESRITSRAGAQVIDLHLSARLRNTGRDYIRGVTLLLLAQESTAGGKMSVATPCMNVAPGEIFPMRIDGRLMRPLQAGNGPLVRVNVDGVLFRNYEFYGPDKLNSRRQMVAWELEADRDRHYFKHALQTRGVAGLQQEMLDSLDRQANRPHLDVQLARGRSTTTSADSPDHQERFAFLEMPDSPVKPQEGWAEIAGNEARAPRIQVQNTSAKFVRYLEIAWLVRDSQGREFLAGSVPASEGELYLPPGRTAHLLQDISLRFSRGGQPVDIRKMTGFVSEVEYSDGSLWIPKRENLQHENLLRILPPSPEEQRLSDLYRKDGVDALVRELNKF
jgi:hypothetical protein